MDFISRFHDPTSGGFYSSRTEHEETTKQDLMAVGYCGLAAVATRVASMLLAKQSHVGSWDAPESSRPNIDVTVEMVLRLDEIYQAVESQARPGSLKAN